MPTKRIRASLGQPNPTVPFNRDAAARLLQSLDGQAAESAVDVMTAVFDLPLAVDPRPDYGRIRWASAIVVLLLLTLLPMGHQSQEPHSLNPPRISMMRTTLSPATEPPNVQRRTAEGASTAARPEDKPPILVASRATQNGSQSAPAKSRRIDGVEPTTSLAQLTPPKSFDVSPTQVALPIMVSQGPSQKDLLGPTYGPGLSADPGREAPQRMASAIFAR